MGECHFLLKVPESLTIMQVLRGWQSPEHISPSISTSFLNSESYRLWKETVTFFNDYKWILLTWYQEEIRIGERNIFSHLGMGILKSISYIDQKSWYYNTLSLFTSHDPLFWEFCFLKHSVLSFLSSTQTGISTETRLKTGVRKEGGIRQYEGEVGLWTCGQ